MKGCDFEANTRDHVKDSFCIVILIFHHLSDQIPNIEKNYTQQQSGYD